MKKLLFFILTGIFLTGCIQGTKEAGNEVVSACIAKCSEEKAAGVDLSAGPCLSNNIAEDWVCDVAHEPRQDIDNLPENQCPAFGKTAYHFVEVDPDCSFIRSY